MEAALVLVISTFLVIYPLWRICARAGFNGVLSLLALIPFLGVSIVGAVLSFAKWPTPANLTKE